MSINNNQQYFNNTKFIKSIFKLQDLPMDNAKELAIVGRSNCGKSSVINSITNKKKLAVTSKTPGRTRAINYFEIEPEKYLVDLPGYGYAKVAVATKLAWGNLIEQYLETRKSLIGIILIMDIRHTFKPEDEQMLLFCKYNNLTINIILNKADQLSLNKSKATQQSSRIHLQSLGINADIQIFSSINGIGIIELREKIIDWFK